MLPPQVIKDYAKTFYEAGLVPAANVHFAVKDGVADGGPFLRPEVLAMMGPPPAARGLPQKERPLTERTQACRTELRLLLPTYLHLLLEEAYTALPSDVHLERQMKTLTVTTGTITGGARAAVGKTGQHTERRSAQW
jgi:hypothetical protein